MLPAGRADVSRGVDVRVTGHHVVVHHPALSVHLHLVPVQLPGRAHPGGRDEEVTAVHPATALLHVDILYLFTFFIVHLIFIKLRDCEFFWRHYFLSTLYIQS